MTKTKEVLAAGIVQDIQFCSMYALEMYLYGLEQRKVSHKVLKTYAGMDGSVIIRIVKQYNGSPLIQLYKED